MMETEPEGDAPETDASGQQHGDAGGDVVQGDKVVNETPEDAETSGDDAPEDDGESDPGE